MRTLKILFLETSKSVKIRDPYPDDFGKILSGFDSVGRFYLDQGSGRYPDFSKSFAAKYCSCEFGRCLARDFISEQIRTYWTGKIVLDPGKLISLVLSLSSATHFFSFHNPSTTIWCNSSCTVDELPGWRRTTRRRESTHVNEALRSAYFTRYIFRVAFAILKTWHFYCLPYFLYKKFSAIISILK